MSIEEYVEKDYARARRRYAKFLAALSGERRARGFGRDSITCVYFAGAPRTWRSTTGYTCCRTGLMLHRISPAGGSRLAMRD